MFYTNWYHYCITRSDGTWFIIQNDNAAACDDCPNLTSLMMILVAWSLARLVQNGIWVGGILQTIPRDLPRGIVTNCAERRYQVLLAVFSLVPIMLHGGWHGEHCRDDAKSKIPARACSVQFN